MGPIPPLRAPHPPFLHSRSSKMRASSAIPRVGSENQNRHKKPTQKSPKINNNKFVGIFK